MTVNRRFDDGTLKGYKLPKSGVRRVPYRDLVVFMKVFSIPLEFLRPYAQSHTILVAAEDHLLLRHLSDSLAAIKPQDEDMEIQNVSSAFEAGRLFERFQPDLFVVDVSLPGVNARQLAAQIKSQADCTTKIVGISGSIREDSIGAPSASGFDAVLSKPVNPEALLNTARELLNLQPGSP